MAKLAVRDIFECRYKIFQFSTLSRDSCAEDVPNALSPLDYQYPADPLLLIWLQIQHSKHFLLLFLLLYKLNFRKLIRTNEEWKTLQRILQRNAFFTFFLLQCVLSAFSCHNIATVQYDDIAMLKTQSVYQH